MGIRKLRRYIALCDIENVKKESQMVDVKRKNSSILRYVMIHVPSTSPKKNEEIVEIIKILIEAGADIYAKNSAVLMIMYITGWTNNEIFRKYPLQLNNNNIIQIISNKYLNIKSCDILKDYMMNNRDEIMKIFNRVIDTCVERANYAVLDMMIEQGYPVREYDYEDILIKCGTSYGCRVEDIIELGYWGGDTRKKKCYKLMMLYLSAEFISRRFIFVGDKELLWKHFDTIKGLNPFICIPRLYDIGMIKMLMSMDIKEKIMNGITNPTHIVFDNFTRCVYILTKLGYDFTTDEYDKMYQFCDSYPYAEEERDLLENIRNSEKLIKGIN